MGILIKIKKVSKEPKSIEDLKKMSQEMDDSGDTGNEDSKLDESEDNSEDKPIKEMSPDMIGRASEKVQPDAADPMDSESESNPQDRNSNIDEYKNVFKKGSGTLGLDNSKEEGMEDERVDSFKKFLEGILGLL